MIPTIDVPAAAAAAANATACRPATMPSSGGGGGGRGRGDTSASNHIKEDEPFDESDQVERLRGDKATGAAASTASKALPRIAGSQQQQTSADYSGLLHRLIEKSVIIHKDENGFGLRVKGQQPVFVEHVHENGAAWRAGVRKYDCISKVNGTSVNKMDHKEVVLMFKSCTRFVGLTLISPIALPTATSMLNQLDYYPAMVFASGGSQEQLCTGKSNFNLMGQNKFRRCCPTTTTTASSLLLSRHSATSTISNPQCSSAFSQQQQQTNSRSLIGSIPSLSLSLNQSQQQQQQQQPFPLFSDQEQLIQLRSTRRSSASLQGQQYPILVAANGSLQRQQSQEDNNEENYEDDDDDEEKKNISLNNKQQQTLQHERQQIVARRSESVSFRPSYFSYNQQYQAQTPATVFSSSGNRQQHISQFFSPTGAASGIGTGAGICERRTSVGGELEQRSRNNQKQLADYYYGGSGVCINCRQTLNNFEETVYQQSSELRSPSSIQFTCFQCQLKLSANTASSQSRAQMVLAESQRQRSYSGPKEQQQHQQQQQTTTGDSGNQMKMISNQQQAGAFFKLSQSASTNSLPTDVVNSSNVKNVANQQQQQNSSLTNTNSQQQQQHVALSRQPTTLAPTNKRLEIIKEFIDTEKTHTDRLRCLDELFYRPLKVGGFMTAEQLRMVFSCHKTLYKIHRQIYRILLSADYTHLYTTEPMIGSALLEIFEGDLKRRLERAACSFCVAQSTNADLLNKLTRRDTKVGEFLAQVTSQQMVGRLGIKDLLASCFQRLTKYPLLLENLLKATPQPEPVEPKKARANNMTISRGINNKLHSPAAEGAKSGGGGDEDEDEDEEEVEIANENPDSTNCNIANAEETEEADEADEEEEEELEKVRNSRRMLAISLAEEREFIERALNQSRQILVRVNESVKVSISHNKLKEIWKRTDKYPGVPLVDITKQQVVHEGLLTLRLSKRSFDVYVLLLSNYIIILTREGQDKYRLKFFTPEGKSSNNPQSVYSPVFVIDEHLTTRDAATDENGFYLLCKRKDDSRIYEFASRSPAERLKWRDRIQWTIERQMSKCSRRQSYISLTSAHSLGESSITKSSSEISTTRQENDNNSEQRVVVTTDSCSSNAEATNQEQNIKSKGQSSGDRDKELTSPHHRSPASESKSKQQLASNSEPTKIEGTISYVEDDGIVMPSKMESSRVFVDQAIQVNIFDSSLHRKPVPSN